MSYIGNDLATDQVFLPDGIGALQKFKETKIRSILLFL
jgi:hypothetical protein